MHTFEWSGLDSTRLDSRAHSCTAKCITDRFDTIRLLIDRLTDCAFSFVHSFIRFNLTRHTYNQPDSQPARPGQAPTCCEPGSRCTRTYGRTHAHTHISRAHLRPRTAPHRTAQGIPRDGGRDLRRARCHPDGALECWPGRLRERFLGCTSLHAWSQTCNVRRRQQLGRSISSGRGVFSCS